tara:strand:- start:2966 stop:3826 length:861 start_codon:yes stop_codon:yes gene_type:complete
MPTNVGDLTSDDLANAAEGVWYYYDPNNNSATLSGHGDDWVSVDSNGISFFIDTNNTATMGADRNDAQGCRVSTMLMKPDGSGQITADEIQGIDFRVEAGVAIGHANLMDIGVAIGVSKKEIGSTDSSNSTASEKFGLGGCYANNASTIVGASGKELGGIMYTPSHSKIIRSTASHAIEASFEFHRKTDTEIFAKYATGYFLDADLETGTLVYQWSHTSSAWALADKLFLWVQPFSYQLADSGSEDVRATGSFKVWYRLRYSALGRVPTWVTGRVNDYSGVSTDQY